MAYEPFYERFPKIAEEETRKIISLGDLDLPDGEYVLIEAYCNEPNCDCRRVFFNVYSPQRREVVAVIAYGWESRGYYRKWFGKDEPRILDELKGPSLNALSPQSELAPVLLQKIEWVLQDKQYVARIRRHYKIFKAVIDREDGKGEKTSASMSRARRNDPCPCGSGKKYKHCCG